MGFFDFFKKKSTDDIPVIDAHRSTSQSSITYNTKILKETPSKNEFEDLSVNAFLDCIPNTSTEEQVKESLNKKGIQYKEYPSFGKEDEKDIVLTFATGSIDWNTRLTIKKGKLRLVALAYYNPNCYKTYREICEELSKRYGKTYDIEFSECKSEGTEKMAISDKEDAFSFTEIEYDPSLILGQKNVYIRYF